MLSIRVETDRVVDKCVEFIQIDKQMPWKLVDRNAKVDTETHVTTLAGKLLRGEYGKAVKAL